MIEKCVIYAAVREGEQGEFIDLRSFSLIERLAMGNAKEAERTSPQYYEKKPIVRIGAFQVLEERHIHEIIRNVKLISIEFLVKKIETERELLEKMQNDEDDTYQIGFIKGISEVLEIFRTDFNQHREKVGR